jgi:glycosyltransferase involved in cell wall biosynthesis
MKVSVIIPNYNHAVYLKERIESVLNQSFQDFEVIILDDGSTDNSKEVIDSYKNHPKISRIVYNEINSGSTFSQWEKGIEMARGELIWIAESDDFAEPSFLHTMIGYTKTNVSLVYCRSKIVDVNGIELSSISNGFTPEFEHTKIDIGSLFANNYMIKFNSVSNASSVLFRKSFVDMKIFEQIKKLRLLGDWIFWLHLMKKNCKVVYCEQVLNNFRLHQNTVRNFMHNNENQFREYIILTKYINKEFGFKKEAIDHLMYLFFLRKEIWFNISILSWIRINSFLIMNSPILYFKSFAKALLNLSPSSVKHPS